MEQIGKRIRINGSEIRISSPKNIFMLLFMPVWLCGWTIGGFAAISQVISMPGKEAWFLILWLCGWIFGEVFVLYAFLWGAFGYESVKIDQGIMSVRRSIFGYGLLKDYPLSGASNLRASGLFGSPMSWRFGMTYWGISGGSVAFEYAGKTRRFGINLNEDEANQLVVAMKKRFNL
jgi:hypothetical protein